MVDRMVNRRVRMSLAARYSDHLINDEFSASMLRESQTSMRESQTSMRESQTSIRASQTLASINETNATVENKIKTIELKIEKMQRHMEKQIKDMRFEVERLKDYALLENTKKTVTTVSSSFVDQTDPNDNNAADDVENEIEGNDKDDKDFDSEFVSTASMVGSDPEDPPDATSNIYTNPRYHKESPPLSMNGDNQSQSPDVTSNIYTNPRYYEESPPVSVNDDNQSDSYRIESAYPHQELEQVAACSASVPNLFNTEGIYIHAIVNICYSEMGAFKSWLCALGALSLIVSQMTLLYFFGGNIFITSVEQDVNVSCGLLNAETTITLVLMSIIFMCIVFEDIRESVVEEIIMNHALLHRKENIASKGAARLVRICLRLRRFVLPWYLIACAVRFLLLPQNNIDASGIILNFVSIGIIIEADNFWGRFLFSERDNQKVDKVVAHVMKNYDDQDRANVYLSSTSLMWPRMLAVIPTMLVSIVFITISEGFLDDCAAKLQDFIRFHATMLLPVETMSIYQLICFIRYKRGGTLFERWMRMLGDWIVNMAPFTLLAASLNFSDYFRTGLTRFLSGIGMELGFTLLFLGSRFIYVSYLENREKTWKHVIFVIFWSLYFGGFFVFWLFNSVVFFTIIKLPW